MEFPDHATVIPGLRNQFGNDWRPLREALVAVSGVMDSAWVETAHETCPARRADGALAVSVREGRARANQFIEYGGAYIGIAQGTDCVEALLVGAVPEDIRSVTHLHYGLLFP